MKKRVLTMKRNKLITNVTTSRWLRWWCACAVAGVLLGGTSTTASAQSTPPVRGTIALQGTMKKLYAAANTIVVTTIDGVDHVVRFTKDLVVHGGKGAGVDALSGLREGTTVVVHYTVTGAGESAQEIDRIGDGGLKVTEGVVTRVDRGRKEITIRFDSGKTETLRLTDRAATDAGRDVDQTASGAARVIVYYSDEAGQKVAHFFKKAS
jgi:hypothetical protein